MNIGMLLTNEFPPDSRVEKEARTLINAGHTVFILCLKFKKNIPNENYKGIHIVRAYISRKVHKKLFALVISVPFYRWFWRKQIDQFIVKNDIDVLHVHDLPLCGEGIRAAKKKDILLVADMHENYPELVRAQRYANTFIGKMLISKKKWYKKERDWLNQIDNIICTATEMRKRMSQFVMNSKLWVVPNKPDISDLMRHQRENEDIKNKIFGKFNLFYFGKIDNARGVDTLIDAIAFLKGRIPDVHAIIIGYGIMLEDYKRKVTELGLGGDISFEGRKSEKDLKSYMTHVDICILPHRKSRQTDNTSPNKLFLYMAFSKSVIVSNCNYIMKIIHENDCGMVFESGNPQDLAEKIHELYRHPELRERYGSNGGKAINEKLNWENKSKPLVELYRQLAKEINKRT
jgi:glycosyltransferase involved in cell wall biosynthesis